MPSKGVCEMVPDRLESWYAAECDAEAGVSIAGKLVKLTDAVLDPRTGEERRGETAMGTKKRVLSIFELLAAGGAKPGMIKTHEAKEPD